MKKDIVLIDLFSGIGGFSKGLIDAGFNITRHYFSEIDKHAIANYKYNFPDAKFIGSVIDVSGTSIRDQHPNEHIIVTFGFPCQDISIAGKRRGLVEGTRSSLLFEAGRIVTESKAQTFIAENVKGLSSVNEGRSFYEVLKFLTYLNSDSPQYTVEVQLLNTSWLLPQNRERYYFIGHIGTKCKQRIFPITENDFRTTERSGDTTTVRTLDTQSNQAVIVAQRGRNPENSSDRTPGAPTVQRLEVNEKGQSNALTGVQKDNLVLLKCISHYGHKDKDAVESDIVPTLKAESHGHEPMIVNTNMAGQQFENDYAGTLRAGASANYMTVSNIRRLTEIECERLQGFPDNWTKFGIYEKQVWINKKEKTFRIVEGVESVSKTQRYKMCGNAVTVSIVELIGKKLLSGI